MDPRFPNQFSQPQPHVNQYSSPAYSTPPPPIPGTASASSNPLASPPSAYGAGHPPPPPSAGAPRPAYPQPMRPMYPGSSAAPPPPQGHYPGAPQQPSFSPAAGGFADQQQGAPFGHMAQGFAGMSLDGRPGVPSYPTQPPMAAVPPPPMSQVPPPPPMHQGAPAMPQAPAPFPPMHHAPPPPMSQQQQQPMMAQAPAPAPAPAPSTGAPQPPAKPAAPASKIDPNQIPSPVAGHYPDMYRRQVFNTRKVGPAPSACSNFVVVDEGNCSPRFIRPTIYQAPNTSDLLTQSSLVFGAVIHPLATIHPDEEEICLVDFGPSGPLRCRRCRAYVNPFFQFIDQGRKFNCNMCGVVNDVPREYVCPLDGNGIRRDVASRPELRFGSVDYLVSLVPDYNSAARPVPVPRSVVFVCEWGPQAHALGFTRTVVDSMRAYVASAAEGDADVKIGFIAYNKAVHFYNIVSPNLLVMSDVDDPFLPLPASTHIMASVKSSRDAIEEFIDRLSAQVDAEMADGSHGDADPLCMGAALQAAYMTLDDLGGDGKVLLFGTRAGQVGAGKINVREDLYRNYGLTTDVAKEKGLYLPNPSDAAWYKDFAEKCAKKHVSVDLYVFPSHYMEMATIGLIPRLTGGQVFSYTNFNFTKDYATLMSDIRYNLSRFGGHDAILRVRTSKGLSVKQYFGNFLEVNPGDCDIADIDCDKAVACEFKLEEKLEEKSEAYIQAALLYTTRNGERRIRVHTLGIPVSTTMANLFRNADIDASLNIIAKKELFTLGTKFTAQQARDNLTELCVNILTAYRKHCATSPSPGQLILPEALKLLPVYVLALSKTSMFRAGNDVSFDARFSDIIKFGSMPVNTSTQFIYPRLFAMHKLPDGGGKITSVGDIILPPPVGLTSEKVDSEGIYLFSDTYVIYLWVGKRCDPEKVKAILGVSFEEITPSLRLMPQDNELSMEFHRILQALHSQTFAHQAGLPSANVVDPTSHLTCLREGDVLETMFFSRLLEDRGSHSMSYVEYLCHVHRSIQTKLS